ncbi:MAG: putative lipopolysaccharide heptosyltransferase III [Burkholderiales bacterium]|jgi:heptosyltransferase-3|nr:putative lipopolysaccharide heptosyltransferase III [Burkholderiales bacterium]
MSAESRPPFTPQRVLITKFRHHGDVLLTTPLIRVLHHYFPGVETDALIYRETEDMLRHNPQVAHRWIVDRNWKKEGARAQAAHEWRLWRALKARRFDLLIHLTESWRGVALARGLGVKRSIAFAYPRRDNFFWKHGFTDLVSLPETPCHNVALQLSTLTALGLTPKAENFPLSLSVDETAHAAVLEALRRAGWQGQPYLLIHPGARWFFKCWENASFATLIDALIARSHTIVLTGAPEARETEMAADILARLKENKSNVFSLVGQLSLAELAAAIDEAQFFIGVDSVPMHMAAALQKPGVVLFGPSKVHEWSPWQAPITVLKAADWTSLPHPDSIDTATTTRYLAAIPAEAVLEAVLARMATITQIKGLIEKPSPSVSIEDMNAAIAAGGAGKK